MRPVHAILLGASVIAAFAAASACYPQPLPADVTTHGTGADGVDLGALQATEDLAAPVLAESALVMPRGYVIRLHPGSDGGSFASPGFERTWGLTDCDAGTIWVANADLSVLCHEEHHAARDCAPFDHIIEDRRCVSGWFCEHDVDRRCAESQR